MARKKAIFITGAGSGIGQATARHFAAKGWFVGLAEALDTEWSDDGIRVRSLMPSFIDTLLLAGPAGAKTNVSKRDRVVEAGMEFTPVEVVAQCAWDAIHGNRVHTLVGKTAKQMGLTAKWAPGFLRKRAKRLMQVCEGQG